MLDFDDTEDMVHGGQQLALFNAFFGEYSFMPLHVYEGISGKLLTTILRPGQRMDGKQVVMILKRLIARLREAWPDTRFIVTDLLQAKTQALYREIYCARGKAELFIKDHKRHLQSDRTSCTRFEANQFRLLLHSAAYILLHTMRAKVLRKPDWRKATFRTIQLKVLKSVRESMD